ncbi:MAG TPA: hypothetical protein VI461_15785 [Chitinophagaceae bacterium]|nr:hypothetical protein [Chitinophagaceae bacterium]
MLPVKNYRHTNMNQPKESFYNIPAKYRKMENMHIVFWLMKDISWCMIWKVLGITMIVPTLSIAIIIAWRTRKIKSELAHNLAIAFWISANSLWMISEFFYFDEMIVWKEFTGKHLALVPFVTGALILLYYYVIQRPRELKEKTVVTM